MHSDMAPSKRCSWADMSDRRRGMLVLWDRASISQDFFERFPGVPVGLGHLLSQLHGCFLWPHRVNPGDGLGIATSVLL